MLLIRGENVKARRVVQELLKQNCNLGERLNKRVPS